jgi:hypothetical protein
MALQQTITLPSGIEGNYIRCDAYSWDRSSRQCTARLALYVSAAVAADGQPIAPTVAKLRLYDEHFDAYFAGSVLAALDTTTDPIRHQIYEALKAAGTLLTPGAGLTELDLTDALNV